MTSPERKVNAIRLDVISWILAYAEPNEANHETVAAILAALSPSERREALTVVLVLVGQITRFGDESRRVDHPKTPRELLEGVRHVCREELES